MTKRKDISDTILYACKSVLPDIDWNARMVGADRNNGIAGTVSCDKIDFINEAKGIVHATASYEISIIDLSNNYDVDSAADELFDVFNDSNMGGICYSVQIKRVTYGSIQNRPDANVCIMQLVIEFPYEVQKGVNQ